MLFVIASAKKKLQRAICIEWVRIVQIATSQKLVVIFGDELKYQEYLLIYFLNS